MKVGAGARETEVARYEGERHALVRDGVAHEEPLELQVAGVPLAVLMRTPGHDAELACGFLLTERVVARAADVESVRHCSEVAAPEADENVVRVTLAPGVRVDLEALRRNLFASSSCGVCGKATLENAMATAPPLEAGARFEVAALYALPERLRRAQPVFDATGGLHAAALFDADGHLLAVREDVGRHNAVDKVVGWALREGVALDELGLLVSGRPSFEVVQKALAARVPLVAGFSAPSSLAVALALEAGMGLVGFLAADGFNAYAGRERLLARS